MGFFKKILNVWADYTLKSLPIPSEPPATGKSLTKSIDDAFGWVNPDYPYELVEVVRKLMLVNPDFSQAMKKFIRLSNTGHKVTFSGLSKKQTEKANERVRDMASTVFRPAAGIDSLVDSLHYGILEGALCAEIVPRADFMGVDKVVLPDISTIRFKKVDSEYVPYQFINGEEIELNSTQFMYIPSLRRTESPYGAPEFTAAVGPVKTQIESTSAISKILKKFGILGFIHAKLSKPTNLILKSESEQKKELQIKLDNFGKALKKNYSSGVMATYDDVDAKHNSVTSDARGAKEIFNMNEEQLASGLDIDPALLGRSYSTTETYANVSWQLLKASNKARRRATKRFIERLIYLDLVMVGFPLKSVKVTFNPDISYDVKTEEEAENIKTDRVIKQRDAGFIDDDKAAQLLGYEKATGKQKTKQASFSLEEVNKIIVGDFTQLAKDDKKKTA